MNYYMKDVNTNIIDVNAISKKLENDIDRIFAKSDKPVLHQEYFETYLYLEKRCKESLSLKTDYLFRSVFSSFYSNRFMTMSDKDIFFEVIDKNKNNIDLALNDIADYFKKE